MCTEELTVIRKTCKDMGNLAGQNSNIKKKGGHEFPSLDEELLAIDNI